MSKQFWTGSQAAQAFKRSVQVGKMLAVDYPLHKDGDCHVCGQPLKTKVCSSCKKVKPVGDFYKTSRSKTGLGSWCAECHDRFLKDNCRGRNR